MKTKVISLSAISSAIVAIFLTAGYYIEIADLFFIIIASVFVILPLYYNSYMGAFLTFLVGGIIAFMISGFNILSLAFVCYFSFGAYPILACFLRDKKVKSVFIYLIGVIWCMGMFVLTYFYSLALMPNLLEGIPESIKDYILLILMAFSIVFYFVYDRFIVVSRILMGKYLKKIIK